MTVATMYPVSGREGEGGGGRKEGGKKENKKGSCGEHEGEEEMERGRWRWEVDGERDKVGKAKDRKTGRYVGGNGEGNLKGIR